jgi:hypothetical protein
MGWQLPQPMPPPAWSVTRTAVSRIWCRRRIGDPAVLDPFHVSYGEGMVASDVCDRDWCSRCSHFGEPDSAALYAQAEKAERDLLERRAVNRARRR